MSTPASYQTSCIGSKRTSTTITWHDLFKDYEPEESLFLAYDLEPIPGSHPVEYKMTNIEERSASFHNGFVGSLSGLLAQGKKIILLNAHYETRTPNCTTHIRRQVFDTSSLYNTLLQNTVPGRDPSSFTDGVVGMGIGRWAKSLFWLLLESPNNEQTDIRRRWFHQFIMFVTGPLQHHASMTMYQQWFGPVRVALHHSRKAEDVLVMFLLRALLQEPVSREETFRWLELGLFRAMFRMLKSMSPPTTITGTTTGTTTSRLADNIAMPVAILFSKYLLEDDMDDTTALETAFQKVSSLTSFDDSSIIRHLLHEVVPETEHCTDLLHSHFLQEIQRLTSPSQYRFFYPPSSTHDITFHDGKTIVHQPTTFPLHLQTIQGSLEYATEDGGNDEIFRLHVDQSNDYIPILFDVPAQTRVTLRIWGKVSDKSTDVSGHGAGILVRTFDRVGDCTTTTGFKHKMGPTLKGGIGDGVRAPVLTHTTPSYMSGTTTKVDLCMIEVDEDVTKVYSREWTTPVRFEHSSKKRQGAVFLKGMQDITFSLVTMATARATTVGVGETRGKRFSELVGQRERVLDEPTVPLTPLEALQKRVVRTG
jgi:hypothetical protein